MIKNPLFTLVLGLMGGLALGYVFAERQPVPRANAVSESTAELQNPAGHPPLDSAKPNTPNQQVDQRAAGLQKRLAKSPNDVELTVALGNLYFDASRWGEAREWYEQTLEIVAGNADVMTDLAVVYRNLKQPDRALMILDQVVRDSPSHWQALYNRVVVLHFDLGRNDEAIAALRTLEELAAVNSQIPDMTSLANQIRGG